MLKNAQKHGRVTRERDIGVEYLHIGRDAIIDVWLKQEYRVISVW